MSSMVTTTMSYKWRDRDGSIGNYLCRTYGDASHSADGNLAERLSSHPFDGDLDAEHRHIAKRPLDPKQKNNGYNLSSLSALKS